MLEPTLNRAHSLGRNRTADAAFFEMGTKWQILRTTDNFTKFLFALTPVMRYDFSGGVVGPVEEMKTANYSHELRCELEDYLGVDCD